MFTLQATSSNTPHGCQSKKLIKRELKIWKSKDILIAKRRVTFGRRFEMHNKPIYSEMHIGQPNLEYIWASLLWSRNKPIYSEIQIGRFTLKYKLADLFWKRSKFIYFEIHIGLCSPKYIWAYLLWNRNIGISTPK